MSDYNEDSIHTEDMFPETLDIHYFDSDGNRYIALWADVPMLGSSGTGVIMQEINPAEGATDTFVFVSDEEFRAIFTDIDEDEHDIGSLDL